MSYLPWIVVIALAFVVGAYVETKHPAVNLLGKVLP